MSIQWLAKKLFIPKSDIRFQVQAEDGYLVRLEQKMKEKGIAILEKTETLVQFRCKDTQIGGWHIGAHKIEVTAIRSNDNLYNITVQFLGVKNLGIVITIVLWVVVIYIVFSQKYSELLFLLPFALIFPHLINWQALFVAFWRIKLGLITPDLIARETG